MLDLEFPLLFPLSVDSLDKCLHPGRTFPLHFLGDVAVYIQRKSCGGMAQIFLNGLNIVAGLDAGYRVRVPQIMEAGFRTTDFFCDFLE